MSHQQHFQQQLLQLQQLLQQQQPPPQQASRNVMASQQQQMLNLRANSQASLLNANPMLQRALLLQQMQGNLRGFNMAATPVLQQFFPQATRHSLLGPPPVGISLKPTRLAFTGPPFQRQNRAFHKLQDFPKTPDRRQEMDSASSSSQDQVADETLPVLEVSVLKEASKPLSSSLPETPAESGSEDEPAAKRLRSEVEDSVPAEAKCLQQAEEPNAEAYVEEPEHGNENLASDTSKEKNIAGELKTSEVVSSAGSLKVTIQQSSESRAISTTALKPAHWASEMGAAENSPETALKFYCYTCKTNCCNQQNFQTHLGGIQHQQRLREIQHLSDICFVSLLPVVKQEKSLADKDGESQQRWCNTCQVNFTGDLIKHRRTQEHKLAKRCLRPFCTVCSRHFKTPRKFVEHMKSPEHKQKANEVRLGEKEQGGPEESEELITVDAVGCFEDEEEEEEEEEEEDFGEKGDSEAGRLEKEEPLTKQVVVKEAPLEDAEGNEEYCPETIYGSDFLVPVAGFLCRLCYKFCHSDSAARLAHCKSLMHFENLQRYKASRLQAATSLVDTPFPPQQELDDQQIPSPAAAKIESRTEVENSGKHVAVLTEACQAAREKAVQGHNPAAICGALVLEDGEGDGQGLLSAASNGAWGRDSSATPVGEGPGLCVQKSEAWNEEKAESTAGRFSADEADPGGNENPDHQNQEEEAEPPLQPKGEASSRHLRSTRRRAR